MRPACCDESHFNSGHQQGHNDGARKRNHLQHVRPLSTAKRCLELPVREPIAGVTVVVGATGPHELLPTRQLQQCGYLMQASRHATRRLLKTSGQTATVLVPGNAERQVEVTQGPLPKPLPFQCRSARLEV